MSSARDRRVSEGSAPAEPAPPLEPVTADAEADAEAVAVAETPRAEIAEVLTALTALTERLEREHDRAAHRETVIDRLHEENQRLRRGELQSAFEPVRAVLYRLHDLVRREAGRWAAPDPPAPAHAAALLTAVADEVAEALARTGVERFAVAPGEPYDPVRHRPVAVERATGPDHAGTVTAVGSDGFERDGRVVRKAEVTVAKAPPRAESPAESAEEPPDPSPAEPGGGPRAGQQTEPLASSRPSGLRENGQGETMRPRPCA